MTWWLRFLRFWYTIDLDSALRVGNWSEIVFTRTRIAELNAEIDRRRLLK